MGKNELDLLKKQNRELRQDIGEYDMLMDSAGVCIAKIRLTRGYPLEWCNEAMVRTIGYTKEAYEARFGQELAAFFQGYEREYAVLEAEMRTALAARRRRFDMLLRIPTRTGFIWAQGGGTFTDYGADRRPTAVYGVFTDITALVEAREKLAAAKLEADRANAAKSDFLASMSHDLRTPLNGILSFTDFAIGENNPARKAEYLEKVRLSGRLLLDLVNDTLELSRIESGKTTVAPEVVDGLELEKTILAAIHPAAEQKGVQLSTSLERFPLRYIWVDRLKVQKIALNLLSNAVKYTPAGGRVSLRVEMIDPPLDGCTCRILVEDNGIGMSEEFLKRLYEPFSQEHRQESANVVGTGLGLSIVKKTVQLLNGRISVRSRIHEGTCFTVELPILPAEASSSEAEAQAEDLSRLRGKRALLCEDNELNTEIAVILLQDCGMQVDCTVNGELGVKAFQEAAADYYDVILMDIRMPVMDGYEAARRMQQAMEEKHRRISIIAMSADVFQEELQQASQAGMDGFVSKPIDPGRLRQALLQAIGEK